MEKNYVVGTLFPRKWVFYEGDNISAQCVVRNLVKKRQPVDAVIEFLQGEKTVYKIT